MQTVLIFTSFSHSPKVISFQNACEGTCVEYKQVFKTNTGMEPMLFSCLVPFQLAHNSVRLRIGSCEPAPEATLALVFLHPQRHGCIFRSSYPTNWKTLFCDAQEKKNVDLTVALFSRTVLLEGDYDTSQQPKEVRDAINYFNSCLNRGARPSLSSMISNLFHCLFGKQTGRQEAQFIHYRLTGVFATIGLNS